MSKKRTAKRQTVRHPDNWLDEDQGPGRSRSNSERKYLKDLERELQQFLAKAAGLESAATGGDYAEDPSLALAAEELYRETLLLRTQIRESLIDGSAPLDEVVENFEDTWRQLRESYDELRLRLRPGESMAPRRAALDEEEDYDSYDLYFEDEDLNFLRTPYPRAGRIHRPRIGPKR
ncbi:MAG: hypothetical protein P8Y44_02075 [Acidobacteriota bacterium]